MILVPILFWLFVGIFSYDGFGVRGLGVALAFFILLQGLGLIWDDEIKGWLEKHDRQ